MKLPQLSLRELFLLVVIAAMGCGWWVDRGRLANALIERDREEALWQSGAGETYHVQRENHRDMYRRLTTEP